MLYFILWVIFLLVVILAVPVASFLEKKRHAASREASSDESPDASEEPAAENVEATFEPVNEQPVAADDFAEFEEIR
jgi:flagellar biosynthesis/type III secretory pathway M-ring protein FliF/YscJ